MIVQGQGNARRFDHGRDGEVRRIGIVCSAIGLEADDRVCAGATADARSLEMREYGIAAGWGAAFIDQRDISLQGVRLTLRPRRRSDPVELLQAGHDVTIFDNFCNSSPESIARIERIAGKAPTLVRGDIRDGAALVDALKTSGAHAVIHFAGLKAVGESVQQPLAYYDNNVVGTLRQQNGSRVTVGSYRARVSCSATTAWTATVLGETGTYRRGSAAGVAAITFLDQVREEVVRARATATISLR